MLHYFLPPNYPFLTLMLPFWLWLRESLFFSTTFSLWLISFFTSTFSFCLTFFDRNFLWFYSFKQSLPHIRSFSLPYFYCILDCNCSSVYLNRRNRIPNREWNMRKKKRVEWCHSSEVNGQYNRVTTTHVIHTVIIFWSMVACFWCVPLTHYSHDANNGKAPKSYFVLSWSQLVQSEYHSKV